MRKIKSIVFALAVFALSSCSLFEVSHTIDPQTDFSHYQTFSWYSDGFADSISGLFGVNAAHLDSAIRDTIQQQLQLKGLTLSQPDTADLWVNYQAIAQTTAADRYQYSLEDINQSYIRKQIRYSSSFDASRRFTTVYDQGTFVVDVIDRNDLQVVWRGTVETPIGLYDTEAPRIARMQKAIKKLMMKYPAQ
ncbi:DUF4136 domain-containing protein [Kaarinaea lacus]